MLGVIFKGEKFMTKILVVDDNQEDLDTMKEILEANDYEVVTASDGAQALDILVEDGFKLIIIDIQMPTLSGYDLLRLLREKINHDSKMIYASIVPEKEVDLTDVDGFIQKPFSPDSLIKMIKESLS